MKDPKPDTPKVRPAPGDRVVVARYSKAKAKDFTDPRRHGYKAKGGPIERRRIEDRETP